MKIVEQSHEILAATPNALQLIEVIGRTCYKSEHKITSTSADPFVRMLIRRGHESVLEHAHISVRFITNRGTTHEQVRHRVGVAYSQESTRYVNYKGKDIEFVRPVELPLDTLRAFEQKAEEDILSTIEDWNTEAEEDGRAKASAVWTVAMMQSEGSYNRILENGLAPQIARGVLPIDLKTEIVVTANFRTWRHIFEQRCSKAAHPQIRALMQGLLCDLAHQYPAAFDSHFSTLNR